MSSTGPAMASGAVISELGDGRVHVHHGPIELLITIDGPSRTRSSALARLHELFVDLLESLVADLDELRKPAQLAGVVTNPTSQRMIDATLPLAADAFLTPMAAVAGSVADTVRTELWSDDLDRLIVNNGGDIAFGLTPGTSLTVAVADVASGDLMGGVRISEGEGVGGVASSGRGGRSLTTGIADSVTVFAENAAMADAAATVIAGDVDLPGSSRVKRVPASAVDASSDLGDRLVVVEVEPLNDVEREQAAARGLMTAAKLRARGLIVAVVIVLGDTSASLGPTTPVELPAGGGAII